MISSDEIRARLLEFAGLMVFEYQGMDCDIDPFNPKLFHVSCNGVERDLHSIEQVMEEPIFNGAALKDIAGVIKILDW